LASALNHSAERAQTLWFSFLAFMLYLWVATNTTTHRMLFLQSGDLPVFNISLPLLPYYILTQVAFVLFHFYVLLNLVLLARKAKSFGDELERALPEDDEARDAAKALAAAFLDEAHCAGAHGLSGADKAKLKEIAAPAAPQAPKP
jgi:hypothetical protein